MNQKELLAELHARGIAESTRENRAIAADLATTEPDPEMASLYRALVEESDRLLAAIARAEAA